MIVCTAATSSDISDSLRGLKWMRYFKSSILAWLLRGFERIARLCRTTCRILNWKASDPNLIDWLKASRLPFISYGDNVTIVCTQQNRPGNPSYSYNSYGTWIFQRDPLRLEVFDNAYMIHTQTDQTIECLGLPPIVLWSTVDLRHLSPVHFMKEMRKISKLGLRLDSAAVHLTPLLENRLMMTELFGATLTELGTLAPCVGQWSYLYNWCAK